MSDPAYMALALRLAASARGLTSPNPLVGCVIERGGKVLSTGLHSAAGKPHAEIDALQKLDFQASGATLYVNLEPCCHWGRTPPCTEAILRSGISRVVAGMIDPNPLVAGKGLKMLEAAGVAVEVGLLGDRCVRLNEGFSHFIVNKRPFVTLKSALTLDGRVATRTGESQWITSAKARARGHRLRADSDAVLVGVGTVLADNPRLTVRDVRYKGANPKRVVLDTHLRTPPDAAIADVSVAPTLIYCSAVAAEARADALRERGVEILPCPMVEGRLDIRAVLSDLGGRQVVNVLVEGGSRVAGSLVSQRLVDRYALFVAPLIIGGDGAPGFVGGAGALLLAEATQLSFREVRRVGPDLYIDAIPTDANSQVSGP